MVRDVDAFLAVSGGKSPPPSEVDDGVEVIPLRSAIGRLSPLLTQQSGRASLPATSSLQPSLPRRLLRGKWQFPRAAAVGSMARQSRMLVVSRLLRSVVVSFDIVLLGLMVASSHVGWYSAAYRIVFFVMTIIFASHVAFLPEITRSSDEPRAFSLILSRAMGLALTVTLPFAIRRYLIASRLMQLIFGKGYEGGPPALQLLAATIVALATDRPPLQSLVIGGTAYSVAIAVFTVLSQRRAALLATEAT